MIHLILTILRIGYNNNNRGDGCMLSKNDKIREDVIREAVKDVSEYYEILSDDNDSVGFRFIGDKLYYNSVHGVLSFVENKSERTIVALLRDRSSGRVYSRGVAKACGGECYNVEIGRAIALYKALNREVPEYLINAPRPDTPKAGDVIKYSFHDEVFSRELEIIDNIDDYDLTGSVKYARIGSEVVNNSKIIDDSLQKDVNERAIDKYVGY